MKNNAGSENIRYASGKGIGLGTIVLGVFLGLLLFCIF